MGMSHYHIVNGKIVDEWVVYDHLALLAQIKLSTDGGRVNVKSGELD